MRARAAADQGTGSERPMVTNLGGARVRLMAPSPGDFFGEVFFREIGEDGVEVGEDTRSKEGFLNHHFFPLSKKNIPP